MFALEAIAHQVPVVVSYTTDGFKAKTVQSAASASVWSNHPITESKYLHNSDLVSRMKDYRAVS